MPKRPFLAPSPPPLYNFPIGKELPTPELYDYSDLVRDDKTGNWYYQADGNPEA